MKRLEEELLNAMRYEDPPEGFARRVIARAADVKAPGLLGIFLWRGMRWGMAGALSLILIVAGLEYRHYREERAQGEVAKAQLMLALRIAGSKLQWVQSKVAQNGSSPMN